MPLAAVTIDASASRRASDTFGMSATAPRVSRTCLPLTRYITAHAAAPDAESRRCNPGWAVSQYSTRPALGGVIRSKNNCVMARFGMSALLVTPGPIGAALPLPRTHFRVTNLAKFGVID